jgi:hypothetical protein
MEDKVTTMGAKVNFVESKVVAMLESISIIKNLLMQKRTKGRGCKSVTPEDPPPSDVPQNMTTSLVEGITLKEIVVILVPRVETIKPTPPFLKVGSSGQGVDTPHEQCLVLKTHSCSTAQPENSNPWFLQEGRGLSPTPIHPKRVLEESIVVDDLDVHNDVIGHYEIIEQVFTPQH